MLQKLEQSSKKNPCPICDRSHDGDCRISQDSDMVLCHHNLGDTCPDGWRYVKPTADDRCGIFVKDYPKTDRPKGETIRHEYRYFDRDGMAEVVRTYDDHGKKTVRVQSGVNQSELMPYRWHEVADSPEVFIVEGELDADGLMVCGVKAISCRQWTPRHADLLKGKTAIIIPDCDTEGMKKAHKTAKLVAESLVTVKWCQLSRIGSWEYLRASGGLGSYDYFQLGGTTTELRSLITDQPLQFAEKQDQPIALDADKSIDVAGNYLVVTVNCLYPLSHWICIDRQLYKWVGTHYQVSPDSIEERRIAETLSASDYSPHKVNQVLESAKIFRTIHPDLINPSGLNLANGVLEIVWQGSKPTWQLSPHRPNPDKPYTSVSPVRFDPNADTTYCDKLLSALDFEQQDILLKTIGAAFDLDGVRARLPQRLRALLLKGDGQNGKDALREAVSLIFSKGMTACTLADFQAYDQGRKFNLANLRDSRINWASENKAELALDMLQCLKAAVTGDILDHEKKHCDSYPYTPKCVLVFNINKVPSIGAHQEAIKSRYAIIAMTKTFTHNPKAELGEIEADPRFKGDRQFLADQVCPALLNALLDGLHRLMTEGIQYQSTEQALEDARRETNHLIRFIEDMGITHGKGEMTIAELWGMLEGWYVSEGILEITYDKGKKKLTWLDLGTNYDRIITASNRLSSRLLQLFPKAKNRHTKKGNAIIGITKNIKESSKRPSPPSPTPLNTDRETVTGSQSTFTPPSFDLHPSNPPSPKQPQSHTAYGLEGEKMKVKPLNEGGVKVDEGQIETLEAIHDNNLRAKDEGGEGQTKLSFRKNNHDQRSILPDTPDRSPNHYQLEDGEF